MGAGWNEKIEDFIQTLAVGKWHHLTVIGSVLYVNGTEVARWE